MRKGRFTASLGVLDGAQFLECARHSILYPHPYQGFSSIGT
jgi:hypothetical protein